jgi:hypothetical protein
VSTVKNHLKVAEVKSFAQVKIDGAILGICWIEDLPKAKRCLTIFIAN